MNRATHPDILLGLSPADRAELTRLLVEQVEAWPAAEATLDGSGRDGTAPFVRWERAVHRVGEWTRARLALIAAQGPRSTVAL